MDENKEVRTLKIDCPFEGCDGTVDLAKQFQDWPRRGRTSWLSHSLVCRKCGNVIGHFELHVGLWVRLGKHNQERPLFFNPKTKQKIYMKKVPDKYLKNWARVKPKK